MSDILTWQQTGDYLSFKGHRIFVRTQGNANAEPILFLHGFPTSSYDYARVAPLLDRQFRLIFFDYLGYGFSDKPHQHPYSLFEQAEMTQVVAQHFGLTKTRLVAHDVGNSVTLEVMRRGEPEISQLVMLNGSVLLDDYRPLITQKLLLHPIIGPIVTKLRLIRKPAFARQFGKLFATPLTTSEIDEFWSLIQYNDGMGIYHLLIQYLRERKIHEHTWLDALKVHAAPLTVVWGQRDPVAVPSIAKAILGRRPDTAYFPLDDIGHFPQWEAPERVAEIIRQAFINN
ncbi:MAG: alpha/beta hydrolase [Chloroflexi bacterium]|nr:alpha/beta hydrolase [Chloroflexota bacterium]